MISLRLDAIIFLHQWEQHHPFIVNTNARYQFYNQFRWQIYQNEGTFSKWQLCILKIGSNLINLCYLLKQKCSGFFALKLGCFTVNKIHFTCYKHSSLKATIGKSVRTKFVRIDSCCTVQIFGSDAVKCVLVKLT